MEKTVLRQVLMIVGGVIIGAIIWLVWGVPGIAAFSYKPTARYDTGGVMLFSVPQDASAVHVSATAPRVDPTSTKSVHVDYTIEVGGLGETDAPPPSLILYGTFRTKLKTCWSAVGLPPARSNTVKLSGGSDELSPFEAAMVEKNLAEPTANGGISRDSQIGAQQEASANQATKLSFTRITPVITGGKSDYVPSSWTETPTGLAPRTFNTSKATFSCDYAAGAFWHSFGEDRVFDFPTIVLDSGNTSATGVSFGAERDVNIIQDSDEQFSASSSATTLTATNVRNFSNHWYWWDVPNGQIQNVGFSATYTSRSADSDRQSAVLWAGLAGGIVATIAIAVLKTIVDLGLVFFTGWRRNRARPAVAIAAEPPHKE
jgi:hypothetical protein